MATQLKEPDVLPDTGQDDEQQSHQSDAAEAEARQLGWKPEDQYTGKGTWVPADVFMDRQKQFLGLANKRVEQLQTQVRKMEGELKKVRRSEMNAHANALAELKEQMLVSVRTGDEAAFNKLDKQADDLRKNMTEDTPVADRQADAVREFAKWRDDNEWYDLGGLAGASDLEKRQRVYFDRMVQANEDKAATMDPPEFLTFIGDMVEAKYPAERAPRPRGTEAVAGVTPSRPRGTAQNYANLPPDAKLQADRFHANGVYKGTLAEAREKYAKTFDWSNA